MARRDIKTSYAADTAIIGTRRRWALTAASTVVLLILPGVVSNFTLTVLNLVAMASLGSLALNLLIGTAGQISIGTAAFLAIGSFTAAFLGVEVGLPFLVVVPLSAVVTALVGAPVGIPALRLRGLYLLIATLALHFIVIYVVNQYQSSSAGPVGFLMPLPSVFGIELSSPRAWYYALVLCSAVAGFAVANLLRSRYGRAWMAIRDRDIAAEIIGINVSAYKVLAFVISALITGFQGALFAYYLQVVDVDTYTFHVAVQYVAMIVIGGIGSVLGSYLGAAFVIGMPYVVQELVKRIPDWMPGAGVINDDIFEIQVALYGVAIVLFLLIEPHGLAALWSRITTSLRLWPFTSDQLRADGE